jgi:hypothetical protein
LVFYLAVAVVKSGQYNKSLVGELLKLRFLCSVGAATYLIIGGGFANPQSPQLKR